MSVLNAVYQAGKMSYERMRPSIGTDNFARNICTEGGACVLLQERYIWNCNATETESNVELSTQFPSQSCGIHAFLVIRPI